MAAHIWSHHLGDRGWRITTSSRSTVKHSKILPQKERGRKNPPTVRQHMVETVVMAELRTVQNNVALGVHSLFSQLWKKILPFSVLSQEQSKFKDKILICYFRRLNASNCCLLPSSKIRDFKTIFSYTWSKHHFLLAPDEIKAQKTKVIIPKSQAKPIILEHQCIYTISHAILTSKLSDLKQLNAIIRNVEVSQASKLAKQVKELATKPDNLSSVTGAHMIERAYSHKFLTSTHLYSPINKINKILKKFSLSFSFLALYSESLPPCVQWFRYL